MLRNIIGVCYEKTCIHSERIEEEVDIKTPFYYKEKGTVSFTIGEITDKKHTFIVCGKIDGFYTSYRISQNYLTVSPDSWCSIINNKCSKEEFDLIKKQAVDFINSLGVGDE